MREGTGRKPRLTEQERSRVLSLAKQPPPGRLERRTSETLEARDEQGTAHWTLDALTGAGGKLAAAVQEVTGQHVELVFVDQGYTGEDPAQAARVQGMRVLVVRLPQA